MSDTLNIPTDVVDYFRSSIYRDLYLLIRKVEEDECYYLSSLDIEGIFLYAASLPNNLNDHGLEPKRKELLDHFKRLAQYKDREYVFNNIFHLGTLMRRFNFAHVKIVYQEFFES